MMHGLMKDSAVLGTAKRIAHAGRGRRRQQEFTFLDAVSEVLRAGRFLYLKHKKTRRNK